MHTAEELQQFFGEEISRLRFDREPHNLYEPFNYMIKLGGKRLRPVLLMMACELFGEDARTALPQAIAIELFHNFTLIHDDIMDRAPLRRGQPTVHEKFNHTTAILSGDVMLVHAYEFMIDAESSFTKKFVSLFNECAMKVCEGQQLDMNFESSTHVTAEDYLRMVEMKTATLIATALQIGAMKGGASETDAKHLYEFGRELGIAFQLKDDWLDAFGDAAKTGKQPGGDIIQNKKTFLLLEAIKLADDSVKNELMNLFSSNKKSEVKKVKAVLEIFRSLKVDLLTRQISEEHYANALAHLEKVSAGKDEKIALSSLAASLMQRDH